MSIQENPTDETLADESRTSSADGGSAVAPDTMTLAEMNVLLGKDFKDKDTALKAVKDTFSYVGKRREDIAAEIKATEQSTAQSSSPDVATKSDILSLKKELFYAQNPQYKSYESIISKMGSDPSEVVALPDFKTVFDKVKVADEAEQKKSVVSSNARLAETKTYHDEAIKVANARGSTGEDVATVLAKAINEASFGK